MGGLSCPPYIHIGVGGPDSSPMLVGQAQHPLSYTPSSILSFYMIVFRRQNYIMEERQVVALSEVLVGSRYGPGVPSLRLVSYRY